MDQPAPHHHDHPGDHANGDGPTARLDAPLEGAHCAGCVARIEDHVHTLPGIHSVNADLVGHMLRVRYEPGKVTPQGIAKAVEKAGYAIDLTAHEAGESPGDRAHHHRHAAEADVRRRVLVAAPIAALFIADHITGAVPYMGNPWVQFALATVVQFYSGWTFLKGAAKAARAKAADMDTLIALGTSAAYGFSVANLFFPAFFAAAGVETLYFGAAVEIVALVLIGHWLEARARARTGTALTELAALQPDMARRLDEAGKEEAVPVNELSAGDRIAVAAGERIPVDGEVAAGTSTADLSALTGESEPVELTPGDDALSGAVNLRGRLEITATRVGESTTLSQLIRLAQEAQGTKAPIQRLADRISAVFVPTVMALAALSFVGWWLWGPEPVIANAIVSMITVLIIACPCALGLATPTAIVVGVGRGAKAGILFKDAAAVERLNDVKVVALDKTGTLTEGRPGVVALAPAEGVGEAELLAAAAAAEQGSRHPLATGILRAAEERGVDPAGTPESTEEHSGGGIEARMGGGRTLWVGQPRLLQEGPGVTVPDALLAALGDRPLSVVAVADGDRLLGLIGLADPLRDDAAAAVADLKARGLVPVLLTGDREPVARWIAEQAGVERVYAELLPGEKLKYIKQLEEDVGPVVMVGDGINDAPALGAARVGMAIGAGSDIAAEAGDVVLVESRMADVVHAIDLGRATLRTIKENLFLSLCYNSLAIPAAMGLLYPFFGLRLEPWMAAAAMALSDVSVVVNSLRLKRRRYLR